MAPRRPFATVQKDNNEELEGLINLAVDNKEEIDYKIIYLQRRISRLSVQGYFLLASFVDFCVRNNISRSFGPMYQGMADFVYPNTTPEQGLEIVKVKDIMTPNVSDESVLRLKRILIKKYPTFESDINAHMDTLYKTKTNKASLEKELIDAKKAQMDFNGNLQDSEDIYKILRKNMEDLKTFQKYMIEFRSLFDVIPDVLTSETASKFHTNYIDKYSTYYVARKKSIVKATQKMTTSFGETYNVDQEQQRFFVDLFGAISVYVGSFLPEQYVDSIALKNDIIDGFTKYITKLQEGIDKVKFSLEALRGTSGTGNAVLDSFITNTIEIVNSPANSGRLDKTTLDQVIEDNRIIMENVKKKMDDFKNLISNGVSNLADSVAQGVRHELARLSGYKVMKYIKDHDAYKEDHVREKVRRKYGGNVPFCDEVTLTDAQGNVSYVKKTEIDPKTGKKIVDVEAQAALDKSGTSNSILN